MVKILQVMDTFMVKFQSIMACHNNTWVAVRSVNPNDATGNKDILYARFYLEG